MWYYVAAMSRPTPVDTLKKERGLKFKLMSVFYTLHRHDDALSERFLLCGGAAALVQLLAEDQNVIQSQAIELLLEFLSPMMSLQPAVGSHQAFLHHQVYLCFNSHAFFANLSAIIKAPHELFPKSHEHCLKMMAGAVGWLRQIHGSGVEASALPAGGEVCDAIQAFLDGSVQVHPQVRGLSEDLLEEIKGRPMIRNDPIVELADRK